MKRALSNAQYRRLFTAQVLSVLGSGLTTIALGLLAYELAGERAGAVLGTALAIKMIAYVALAPIAAAIAERLPRKGFLIGLDLARAALVLLLPFVSEIWQVYLLVFLFQAFSAAFTPSFQALIPDVLPEEDAYTEALALSRLAHDLESLLSPMLAGLLLTFMGFQTLFVGNAIGFFASACLIAVAVLPARKPATDAPFMERVTRGVRIYVSTPRLRGLLAFYLVVAAATAMIIVNTVVLVKSQFGESDRLVAMFFAASGIGSMAVALSLPRLLGATPVRLVMTCGAIITTAGLFAAMVALPVLPGPEGALIIWLFLGIGASLIQTPAALVLVHSCEANDRPALFAAQFALSHATWLFAYPLVGVGGANFGLATTFGMLALISGLATILACFLWRAGDW